MTDESDPKTAAYQAYMARVGRETIPCYEPDLGAQEAQNLSAVLASGWLSEHTFTRTFERQLAEIHARAHAIALSNATAAMIVGLKSLCIGAESDVIVPSLSHSADPNAVVFAGSNAVFSDIDPDTLTLDVPSLEAARTPRTRAVLYVAAYGNAAHLDEVAQYCAQNDLVLINDSAPALFGTFQGRPIAAWGDFSVLSFFADKTITTGEGGMFLTDSAELAAEVNLYKHDGRRERGVDRIERAGANFRMTELQAAVGVAQLARAAHFVARKKAILARYAHGFAGLSSASLFQFTDQGDICPHRVILRTPDAPALIAHLERHGIGARSLFMPMHSQPLYASKASFPHTEAVYATHVCLPSAPSLSEQAQDFVIETILRFYGAR